MTTERSSHDLFTMGFWIYLMTDCVLFASLFATYAVLRNSTAGGVSGKDIFDLPYVLAETGVLLVSSLTCGLALLAAEMKHKMATIGWLLATFALGLSFLAMELIEFNSLASDGHTWRASGFLSSYFTLVGTHGAHIAFGLIWMAIILILVAHRGMSDRMRQRIAVFGLFWHFLDVVWIFIFSIVYLFGVAKL